MSTRPRNQWVKLTKTVVDRAKPPAAGQVFIRDSELKGFGLRITANGVKTFIVEKRVEGRSRRKKIARYGELTCEEARREALKYLGDEFRGGNFRVLIRKGRQMVFGGNISVETASSGHAKAWNSGAPTR